MFTIFSFIFFLSIPGLILALIKPSIFKLVSRKAAGLTFGSILVASFIAIGITAPPVEVKPMVVENTSVIETPVVGTQEIATTTEALSTTVAVENKTVTPPPTKETPPTSKVVTTPKPIIVPPKETSPYTYYSVTSVVDGDTVKVNINGTIETLRLIGMDTPETVDPRKEVQCFGKEASNKAKEILLNKKVRIEKDPSQGELDKYGRTLAYIYTENGLFYNKYMIEQGYAHEYTYNTAYKYQVEFKQAQKSAEINKVGLWSPNTCNGDTTSAPKAPTTPPASSQSGIYYTSSASNATKYYPDTCPAWQDLSKTNLRSFNSLADLLAMYPKRVLADVCK